MDWSRLQTYGLSPNKSFEMIIGAKKNIVQT